MRTATLLIIASLATPVFATLPPPSEEAKAQAAQAKAKSDWGDKVAQYQLCLAGDRVAARYRASQAGAAKSAPQSTPPCVDPGPFVAEAKPLEAAGAHSPPETATAPPNTNATHAEITGSANSKGGKKAF